VLRVSDNNINAQQQKVLESQIPRSDLHADSAPKLDQVAGRSNVSPVRDAEVVCLADFSMSPL
jgi:hypothetical protein